jgi:tetratricopeptide (TPR) repeat protein
MNKKPTKINTSSGTTKPKAAAVAKASPAAETQVLEEKFKHSCTTQNFALVWLDENFDQNNSNCRTLVSQLQTILKKVDVFNDTDNCMKFISEIRNLDVYLIISNPEEHMLTHAHRLEQIKAIFIFNDRNSSKKSWPEKWKKIQGIYTNVHDLCKFVKETAKKSDREFQELCFVASNDINNRRLDELGQSFMYTQLMKEILLELEYDKNCVEELVTYCQENRQTIKVPLDGLQEFLQDYPQKKTAVWWYTKDIFLYRLVNWALREQEFDTIIRVGFFINDLHRHIDKLHQEQIATINTNFPVYRGQGMTADRFANLRKSEGGLLAFNSFLSTSRSPEVAQGFIDRALDKGSPIGLLFIITVDPSVSSEVYADIGTVSCFEEKEVLFSLATVFRIGSIKPLQTDPDVWSVELQLTSNKDKELNALMGRIKVEIGGSTPLYKLGALMIKVGQYDKAEEIYSNLWNETNDEQEKANICHQLGFIKDKRGNPRAALIFYQDALTIHRKTLGDDHHNVASVYNNIGLAYDSLNDHSQALDYYQKAQKIYEKEASSNGTVLAACYNNIASVYDHKQDHRQALIFYKKASEIYRDQLTPNHPDLATLENNIGTVHLKKNEHKQAMECFKNAVKIGKQALPPDHADLKTYQNHLDNVSTKLNKYK